MSHQMVSEPTTEHEDGPDDWATIPEEPEPDEVVVRRNGLLSILVACVGALVAAAYFARAATSGGTLDWALCLAMVGLTWGFVFSFLDSRMPLLVADSHGVRIRLGRTWRGMAWTDIEEVEHLPRRPLHDGRLVLFPQEPDGELAMLGRAGRRHAALTGRMLGAPFAVPLGLTTRVRGADHDLTGALVGLADGRCEVVEVVGHPEPEPAEHAEPAATAGPDAEAELDPDGDTDLATDPDAGPDGVLEADPGSDLEAGAEDEPDDEPEDGPEAGPDPDLDLDLETTAERPVVTSPTPVPVRELSHAVRSDVTMERVWEPDETRPVAFVPAIPTATTTFLIDDLADLPEVEPVIGPQLAAAREDLRLSVEQLAERTRIRPHIIDAIEIDDFVPCGGDFYARGHLRTLCRVLGEDAAPLLATYDERYSEAPVDPRRVFEAELATGRHGPIRGTRGGPNWSVVLAAVMAVVLAWSIARLLLDESGRSPSSPSLADGSAGLTSGRLAAPSAPVRVVLTAAGGGARVVVRDGAGKVVFTGTLAFGQSRTVEASPPVRVQTSDGSTEVTVDGHQHGPLGTTGQPAQDVFTAR